MNLRQVSGVLNPYNQCVATERSCSPRARQPLRAVPTRASVHLAPGCDPGMAPCLVSSHPVFLACLPSRPAETEAYSVADAGNPLILDAHVYLPCRLSAT